MLLLRHSCPKKCIEIGEAVNCFVVISDEPIGAPVSYNLEDLIVMNGPSLRTFLPNLKPGGTLF